MQHFRVPKCVIYMSAERYGEYVIKWIVPKTLNLYFIGKSLSYYDRAKSMTDLSGVGSIIGADVSGMDWEKRTKG